MQSPACDFTDIHACFIVGLKEQFIMSLSSEIGCDYLHLGVNLGIQINKIRAFEMQYHNDVARVAMEILHLWNTKVAAVTEKAVVQTTLCDALSEMGRNDLVEFINNGESITNIPHFIDM